MDRTSRFRQILASRLLHVAGVSALASTAALAACGGNVVVDPAGEGGAGGAPSTTTGTSTSQTTTSFTTSTSSTTTTTTPTTTTTGTDPQSVYRCFQWGAGESCPSAEEALPIFQQDDCSDPDYSVTYEVIGGPYDQNGECCYDVLQSTCKVGRPFLVDGRPRAASGRAAAPGAAAWAEAGVAPRTCDLTPAERDALAAAWASDGLLEHASVA